MSSSYTSAQQRNANNNQRASSTPDGQNPNNFLLACNVGFTFYGFLCVICFAPHFSDSVDYVDVIQLKFQLTHVNRVLYLVSFLWIFSFVFRYGSLTLLFCNIYYYVSDALMDDTRDAEVSTTQVQTSRGTDIAAAHYQQSLASLAPQAPPNGTATTPAPFHTTVTNSENFVNNVTLYTFMYHHQRKNCDTDNCVICLAAMDGELVKLLPDCRHVFHAECIDKWLCEYRTCPICRRRVRSI